MISLSESTEYVRLSAKIVGGIIVLILIGYGIFLLGNYILDAMRPPEEPQQAFGELPPVNFGEEKIDATFFTFRLNTVDGRLPAFPDRLPVYKTVQPSPSLLALQNTRERVNSLGYTRSERKIQGDDYQWISENNEIIRFNILTKNFEIFSSYIDNPREGSFSVSNQTLKNKTLRLLENLGISTENMSDTALYRYYVIQNGKYKSIEQNNQAQVTRVDLFQEDLSVQPFNFNGERVEWLPIVYPDAPGSTMYFYLAPDQTDAQIIDAHFTRFEVDRGDFSDYYLKTASTAYEDLKRGNAYIAQYDPNQPRVDITDARLGYFLGENNNGYVIPVVRFIGHNFEAYVEAVHYNAEELEGE